MIFSVGNPGLWTVFMSESPAFPPFLDAFLVHWAQSLKDESPGILGRQFPNGSFEAWTGWLALIERMSDSRFRFLIAGTKLIPRFNRNLTGCVLTDVDQEVLGNLEERIKRAVLFQTPVVETVLAPHCHCKYIDLLFPLSGDEGMEDLILLASCPDQAHLYHPQ